MTLLTIITFNKQSKHYVYKLPDGFGGVSLMVCRTCRVKKNFEPQRSSLINCIQFYLIFSKG